jgi:GNAT superfamily N-acetyltransferase
MGLLVVDLPLATRAEGALRSDAAAFVDGMRLADPGGRANAIPVAGGLAAFTGAGMFACRVQAAGLGAPVGAADIDQAERFFDEMGAPCEFEVCPLADRSLREALAARAYRLVGFRNVYVADPREGVAAGRERGTVEIRRAGAGEVDAWSAVVLDGFGYTDVADRRRVDRWNRMLAQLTQATLFLAYRDGRPVGAANVLIHGAVASLGGTTTVPAFRRRGTQAALLAARLAHARASGCSLAVVTADPGGGSARNIERVGGQLAYTNARLRIGPSPI